LNVRHIALAALAAVAALGTLAAERAPAAEQQTAQVTPAPSVAPLATPAPRGRGKRSAPAPEASPSETPEPPQFSSMDGVWEVQLQPLATGKTVYSHLSITQKGDALTGTWVRNDKQKLPLTGTFDGRLFKLTATGPNNATWTFSGYAENFGDMVGMLTSADPKDPGTPFTASHRKKEKLSV
jgi:hypothetical protein